MQDTSHHQHPGVYAAYLVWLWQDSPSAEWRASAQSAHGGEIMRFANLDALFAFLQAQTAVLSQTTPISRPNDDEQRFERSK